MKMIKNSGLRIEDVLEPLPTAKTYSITPKYKIYRNKKTACGWLQIPVGFAKSLEEAQKMLEQGRAAGLHLNIGKA